MKTNNRGKANNRGKTNNRGKANNRGKTNNHGKAKMKQTSKNNRESFATKMDDRNVHHAYMPEYVYLWFTVFIVKWLKKYGFFYCLFLLVKNNSCICLLVVLFTVFFCCFLQYN